MTGRFITLEGGDGAGKTTQCALLARALGAYSLPVWRTREPGGSPGAELLRGLVFNDEIAWSPDAETLLHFAARAEHVAKTIRPALDSGTWVVCDRFFDSTMAYQGYGQGADRLFIKQLTRSLGIVPVLTLVLDIPSMLSSERVFQRGGDTDRYERLDAAFHDRVRRGFREIAAAEPERCVLLDASADVETVHAAILRAVRSRLRPDISISLGAPR